MTPHPTVPTIREWCPRCDGYVLHANGHVPRPFATPAHIPMMRIECLGCGLRTEYR